ncbi:MFS transporter [Pseudonocardia humida]|uniref:MFS transporter n=1 Tax=Pseudonocardia humida TaxID=2800819 RepID=A0ABT1A9C1_9PSEU|nr:MFS transporter [Pseudonocardia humida]MCO1659641.1 MFS transporter [Pseudonocardia humida]
MAATRTAADVGLRRLLWGRGVSAIGDGLWFTIWALYLTRVLGHSPATVGLGMAVAGAAGLVAAAPIGALADRLDPRRLLVALTAVRAAAMAGYLPAASLPVFLLATVAFVALANGGSAVRTALVAGLVSEQAARVRALAGQRVAQHAGNAVGAGAGALVLALDQPGAYRVAIVGTVVAFLVLAVMTLGVPAPGRPEPRARRGLRSVLRDRPYCALVGVTAVLSLCWAMLSTGLPLWIAGHTDLPLALSGAMVVLSSVGIALGQVPAGRLARTPDQAARTAAWSGVVLAAACLLLATTGSGAGVVAAAVVVGAGVLHLAGELGYVAAGWTLSLGYMREEDRGAYQGATEAATATVQMVGPGLFTLALDGWGPGGWVLAAGIFLVAGCAVPGAARWAARTRVRAGQRARSR